MTDYLTTAQKRSLDLVANGRVFVYPGIGTLGPTYRIRNGGARDTEANPRPFYKLEDLKLIRWEGREKRASYYEVVLTDLGQHERGSVEP
jgi:hypothetical protein